MTNPLIRLYAGDMIIAQGDLTNTLWKFNAAGELVNASTLVLIAGRSCDRTTVRADIAGWLGWVFLSGADLQANGTITFRPGALKKLPPQA